ncbi:MDR family MFS transporter [Streptomyces radicis]|uniref:MFS transporter n=1 Tax=Streptomyces radicis TaxID=1750517 RepID=A0A3A9WKW1_9ACTN|nr:MFS transporter [Streptomyces radicis]RKN08376.1 MFS transporter [Streptomyces radicis]RKN21590.1 MFS transporter [Streptomyces radicis]
MARPQRTGGHTRARDLPLSFWWLWLAVLVTWTGRFVVPFMTLFLTGDAGLSVSAAGLIVSGYGGGVVVSTLGGGVLSDTVGRKRTLVGSLLLSAGTVVIIPLFGHPAAVALLLFAFGLVNGATQPAITALIADMVPPAHRRTAFAYKYWAVNLGYAIGPVIAGFVADRAFDLLFYGQACVLLVSAAIVLLLVHETHVPERAGRAEHADGGGGLLDVLRDRVFMTFVAAMFVYSVVYVQSTVSLPVAMADEGYTTQQYGLLLTLNGLLLCALQIPSARFMARWHREAVLAGALCVTAVGVGLQGVASSWAVYAVAVTIWTLGEMGGHPAAQSIAADMSTRRARGRYLGAYALAFSTATMVGPLVGGAVSEHLGTAALWFGCGAACLLLAVFLSLTAPARQERLAAEAREASAIGAPEDADRPPGEGGFDPRPAPVDRPWQ